MSPKIDVDREKIADFCRRWAIVEFSLFGSVLRQDFRPDSDVDVLVAFAPDSHWGFDDLMEMEAELARLFGRRANLVERKAVERSRNYIRRKHILAGAEPIYVA
jgi:predicted nucleotidyltransferase